MSKIESVPDAVFLDLDDTIYPYEPCHIEASLRVERKFTDLTGSSANDFATALSLAKEQVKSRLGATAASHSRLLYFKRALEILAFGNRFDWALALDEAYWQTFIEEMKIFEGVREFLVRLNSLGIPIVVVTDLTTEIQLRKIIALDLQKLVSFVVTSEEVGIEKPDARPFNAAKELVGIKSKAIWMIGDSESKDIAGANAIDSMISFQKVQVLGQNHSPKHAPTFEFVEFVDLLNLLDALVEAAGNSIEH